jgi:5-methylcytosine-specific restriction endonuclease McrA
MLSDQTLVLNKNWFPIQTTTVRNAICLLFTGAARAIDTDTFEIHDFEAWHGLDPGTARTIETVDRRIRIPEVILLTRYGRIPTRHVAFSRRNLYRRDNSTCQYCCERLSASELTIDHVIPRSRGGRTSWDNCVVACGACNRRKGDRTLEETKMKLLRLPRAPQWTPYIGIDREQRKAAWARFTAEQEALEQAIQP